MKLKLLKKVIFLLPAVLFFNSCNRSNVVASINQNQLFKINYGNFEDELNLFNLSTSGSINTHMFMMDGFFYIANGESKKIMELNSYGDLLSLYYNEDVTKAPSFASGTTGNSTKKAISYPFNSLGCIAVDSSKALYAVDTLPHDRQQTDVEKRLLLSHIVLKFSSDGTFLNYIGQEGPGGTPFPYIKSIHLTKSGELVVICKTNEGSLVFWYNSAGFLLFTVPITNDTVPKLKELSDSEINEYLSVESVIPDTINHKLYVKVDYYQNYLDPATKVLSGIDYSKTLLYPLDVETGRYDDALEIPSHEDSISEKLGKEVYKIPFDFLGVTDNGWFFFYIPTEKGYIVQMVQPNGQKILKRALPLDHSQILYHSLGLNGNGIISGLFIKREHAEIAWWRTDALVAGLMNQ